MASSGKYSDRDVPSIGFGLAGGKVNSAQPILGKQPECEKRQLDSLDIKQ